MINMLRKNIVGRPLILIIQLVTEYIYSNAILHPRCRMHSTPTEPHPTNRSSPASLPVRRLTQLAPLPALQLNLLPSRSDRPSTSSPLRARAARRTERETSPAAGPPSLVAWIELASPHPMVWANPFKGQ
jgi:hypothetical protein